MTNDELKMKIVDILKEAMKPIEFGGDREHAPEVHYPTEEEIADALIAAGIGDLKEHRIFAGKDGSIKQLYSGEEVEKIVKEREEYKHRAEVAERELERYTVLIKPLEAENARLNHLAARAKRALKDL